LSTLCGLTEGGVTGSKVVEGLLDVVDEEPLVEPPAVVKPLLDDPEDEEDATVLDPEAPPAESPDKEPLTEVLPEDVPLAVEPLEDEPL
jgi:hypothetical protein